MSIDKFIYQIPFKAIMIAVGALGASHCNAADIYLTCNGDQTTTKYLGQTTIDEKNSKISMAFKFRKSHIDVLHGKQGKITKENKEIWSAIIDDSITVYEFSRDDKDFKINNKATASSDMFVIETLLVGRTDDGSTRSSTATIHKINRKNGLLQSQHISQYPNNSVVDMIVTKINGTCRATTNNLF